MLELSKCTNPMKMISTINKSEFSWRFDLIRAIIIEETQVIYKTFNNLSNHTALRAEASIFLNIASSGVVFAKVNDQYVWFEHFEFEGDEFIYIKQS